jgi:hypothetical protein
MDTLSTPQVIALCILVGVLAWAWAHYHASNKVSALVATVKAEASSVEKRVEDYSDSEIVKLTGALVARLADTSEQLQAKADADATIARKAALLGRIQAVSSAATVKTA